MLRLVAKAKRSEENYQSFGKINEAIDDFFGKRKHISSDEIVSEKINRIFLSLKIFFNGNNKIKKLKWCLGGDIPDELIFSKENFKLLNNISLIDAVDIAYKSTKNYKLGKNRDIKMTINTIERCQQLGISPHYQGGLLLLYLKLCENIELV